MPVRVGEQFRGIDSSAVSVTSHLLQGKVFCVLTPWNELTKKDLETKIVQNGGTVVQNPGTFVTECWVLVLFRQYANSVSGSYPCTCHIGVLITTLFFLKYKLILRSCLDTNNGVFTVVQLRFLGPCANFTYGPFVSMRHITTFYKIVMFFK